MAESVKVISIDPGVTTGYTYAKIVPGVSLEYFPFQKFDEVDEFWKRLVKFDPRYIVMEDFEFRQGKQRTGINLFPVQLIGIARLYELVSPNPVALCLQKASFGKAYYHDTTLKQLGLIQRGDATNLGHATDAVRHLLQWVTFGAGYQLNGQSTIDKFVTRLDKWDT